MIIEKHFGYQFAIDMNLKTRIFDTWVTTKTQALRDYGGSEEDIAAMDFSEARYLIMTTDVRHYHITKPVLELAKKIKLKAIDNYKWLHSIKDQISQYTYEDSFIIFNKQGSRIVALASTKFTVSTEEDYLHWDMFNINLANADLNIAPTEYAQNAYKLLLQLLSFIELSEIEEITIKPNSQHGFGSKKDPNTLYNPHRFPITMVNSKWATKIYRPGEFMVSPHQRWQPKGPGRSEYELIWIEAYEKKGITIKAKKDNN